jgi:hypothetical protein
MRAALVSASAVFLVVSAVVAAVHHPDRRFTSDDVVLAFASQGFALDVPSWHDLGATSEDALGTTSPELTARGPDGTLLLEQPFEKAEFYVFVATSAPLAEQYFDALVHGGQTPDSFDVRAGNVLVSSDSSFTESGMSAEKKVRIRAAMDALSSNG